ncbi:hypothetical protein KXX47_001374 [Aspergillus fumigatus]|nr:hypothetical protein KXX47_001374 [Aspergillus fumigatus]
MGAEFLGPGLQVAGQTAGVAQRPVRVQALQGGVGQQTRQIAPAAVDAGGADARALGHQRHRDTLAAQFGDQFLEGLPDLELDLGTAPAGALGWRGVHGIKAKF